MSFPLATHSLLCVYVCVEHTGAVVLWLHAVSS